MREIIGESSTESLTRILRLLGRVTAIAVFSTFLSVPLGVIVVEMASLGPRFHYVFFVVPILSIFLAILLDRIPSRQPGTDSGPKPILPTSIENWAKSENPKGGPNGYRWRFVILCTLAIIVVPALAMTPSLMERLSRPKDAEAALRSFVPTYAANIEQNRLERTLAEFERSRRRLSSELSVPDGTPPITLRLFKDLDEYREARNIDWSGGFAACLETGVTIGVPLEEASDVFSENPHSGAPMHEMVHAMMCQILGPHDFVSIQSWFHEGMAKLYENSEISMLPNRIVSRLVVWLMRDRLIHPDTFCNYRYDGSNSEISLFYRTSWEFIRSLQAGHGRHTLIAIVNDVAAGVPFEESLAERLGGTCTEIYAKWSESL